MAWPGRVRTISVYCGVSRPDVISLSLLKNLTTTPLAGLTLGTTVTVPRSMKGSVSFGVGDSLNYFWEVPDIGNPGFEAGACTEIETTLMQFGICATEGGKVAGDAWVGGAFGNGVWQDFSGIFAAPSVSNTFSICSVPGTITRLCLREYSGALTGGSWTGYLVVDGVLQDGSGGTVNTACLLTDANTSRIAVAEFSIHIAVTQRVEILALRNTTNTGFQFENLGATIAMRPDIAGQYMICGGNNNVLVTTGTGYEWLGSKQLASGIERHSAPVGPDGFTVKGLYIVHPNPAVGLIDHTLLRDGIATDLMVPIGPDGIDGVVLERAVYSGNQLITIQYDNVIEPAGSQQLHWGLAVLDQAQILGPIAWLEWPRVNP